MKIYILCADFIIYNKVYMRVKIMNFRIPLVVASEKGTAQTYFYNWGCKGLTSGASSCSTLLCDRKMNTEGEHLGRFINRSTLERGTIEGNSPVCKNKFMLLVMILEYCRA